MQLTGAKLCLLLGKIDTNHTLLFPQFITIAEISNMEQGKQVVWQHDNWSFEGWEIPSTLDQTEKIVIAFHGFDRSADEMESFMPIYDESTAMLSINLLHHGDSKPLPPRGLDSVLEPQVLLDAIHSRIAASPNLGYSESVQLELLGYSMGGRIALSMLSYFPGAFTRLIALAPDGLKMSPSYKFFVGTSTGKRFWELVDKYPKTNVHLLDALFKVGLISSHKHHFGRYHTDNPEIRARVANGWLAHKLFWPKRQVLPSALRATSTSHLIFGARDKIIPFKWSDKLREDLKGAQNVHFHTIACGHVMRHPETVALIKNCVIK